MTHDARGSGAGTSVRPAGGIFRRLVIGIVLTLLIPALAQAQAQNAERFSEDAVKAVFLYRFTGFIEWPPSAPSGDFSIAVLGADGVADALEHLLTDRSIKDRPAHVRKIKRPEEVGDARVVYVGPSRAGDLKAIVMAAADRPILIVSSEEQGLAYGSMVNFILVDQHVRFEVSLSAANRAGLKISSDLLSVASRVVAAGATAIDQPGSPRVASRAAGHVPVAFL